MSKETKPNITRRNVLAGIGATGAGIALGAHGVAAGENDHTKKSKMHLPVALGWQEALNGTDIDAFLDGNNDGTVDIIPEDLCVAYDFEGIDDPRSSDSRTDNQHTNPGDPIINVHGLRPGDQGETTLYYQTCGDVPARVWLKAHLGSAHKKLQHHAMARVWYDLYDEDENDDVDPGDNVYQEFEPVIAQGSLKNVLQTLQGGVELDPDPNVASPDDEEGENYYAFPRMETGEFEYEPVWITDENIKQYVETPKAHNIQNLGAGTQLFIPGVGYVGMDEANPLPDLRVTLTDIIRNKQGEVVGFEWESNLPICRIEVDTDDGTLLNVYNRATEGTVLATDGDDDDDDHDLVPITGINFGVCSDREPECHEAGEVGAIGFEWWVPDDVKLDKKTKMQVDFDVKAKPCLPEAPEDCPGEFEANGVLVELLDCDVVGGAIEGTFRATVTEELETGTQVRVFGPGGNVGADLTFGPNDDVDMTETFTETSATGTFGVAIGTGLANSEFDILCCPEIEPPISGKEAKKQVSDE